MLPFDNRPWAKPLARLVIALSIIAAAIGAYFLHSEDQLHISEITGIVLLLLTIVPPNVAIITRKPGTRDAASALNQPHLHVR